MPIPTWIPQVLHPLYKILMFVNVMDGLESLGPELAQTRLTNIYNTVGLVAALIMSVAMDPFINPPECVVELDRKFFYVYGFILVSSVVAEFVSIIFCTVFLMVVYSVSSVKLLDFVKDTDYVLGAPVLYALTGCMGIIIAGIMVVYACYKPIFYVGLALFVLSSVAPLGFVLYVMYSAFERSREKIRTKFKQGVRGVNKVTAIIDSPARE